MKLSNQAIGAIMMALQKSLSEQSDIVPTLQDMTFIQLDSGQLLVEDPPVVHAPGIKTTESDFSTKARSATSADCNFK